MLHANLSADDAPRPPSSSRLSAASLPDLGEPRESMIIGRYLPDPSLRYRRVAFSGPSWSRLVILLAAALACLAAIAFPVLTLILDRVVSPFALLAVPAVWIALELARPLWLAAVELRNKLFFWRTFRCVDLGLDRSVAQAGTMLRYEVHLHARHRVDIQGVHMRLVFWESWHQKSRLRWSRLPFWNIEKHGHDMVRHELVGLPMAKNQHAVIRGAVRIPPTRPTEHHRGKRKHVSYVNVTVTLITSGRGPLRSFRGNCPHLVTFPWM